MFIGNMFLCFMQFRLRVSAETANKIYYHSSTNHSLIWTSGVYVATSDFG